VLFEDASINREARPKAGLSSMGKNEEKKEATTHRTVVSLAVQDQDEVGYV